MNKTTTLAVIREFTEDLTRQIAAGPVNEQDVIELLSHVNALITPMPEGEAGRLAAQADSNARAMAPPVPDVTVNAGYTVRAVLPGHPAGGGLLASWYVACENDGRYWVTWEAYQMDGPAAGFLAYNAGHYSDGPDPAANKQAALADLAVRAGLMRDIGLRIADEAVSRHPEHGPWNLIQKRERQLAGALRQWCQG